MNTISEMQARGDLFTRKLINEKQRIGALHSELESVNENVAALRESNKESAISLLNKYTTTPNTKTHNRVDGIDPSRLAENNQVKIVKQLESRLGKALVRRNTLQNENDAIKGNIDKLRRKVFNDEKNREQMGKKLIQIKEDVDEIMKRSACVAQEKDRLLERRTHILLKDSQKQATFEKEYNELCTFIANQSKALEDSIASAANNVVVQLNAASCGQGQSNKTKPPDSADDVKKLERKMANLEEDYAATQKTFREVMWKNHHMKERFKELREVSGLSSTEDIIKIFVKNEDECFSLFNYIQEMNQEGDKTILQASKLRKEIDKCRQDQLERENARSATMTVYTELKKEAQNEREKGYTTSIECRRTVEKISRRVTSLYFKLKCHELADKDKVMSKDSLPPQLKPDRKLTTIGGGEVSERNILNLMEMIETRSIQIVDAYLKLSTSKRSRRPSLILVRIVI